MLARVLRATKTRNFLVVVDTALSAASSVVLLIGAARSMDPRGLSDFSMAQLVIVTGLLLQRAFFLSPALAAQRGSGRQSVPLRWVPLLSIPLSILIALGMAFTLGSSDGSFITWLVVSFLAAAVVTAQDCLRFCLFSRGSVIGSVISDGIWLLLITFSFFLASSLSSPLGLLGYWAITGVLAVSVAWLFVVRSKDNCGHIGFRGTWRLGKWSGVDATMSAAANLAPMLLTSLVLGSESAGTYRVLQSALGPLNIISSSLLTMFGLDAWTFVSAESLRSLRSRVKKSVLAMLAFALAYIALAETLVILVSGLDSDDLIRVALIVGLVGIMGAATSPLAAASLALGYQKHGALLRLIIVLFSLTTCYIAAVGLWLPWNDPIGTVTLFAASSGLVGWALSCRRAFHRELKLIDALPMRKGRRAIRP